MLSLGAVADGFAPIYLKIARRPAVRRQKIKAAAAAVADAKTFPLSLARSELDEPLARLARQTTVCKWS